MKKALALPIQRELMGRAYQLLSPASWSYVMTSRSLEQSGGSQIQSTLKKEMQCERAFVQAGSAGVGTLGRSGIRLVFKNGIGYDSERIYESVRGFVGLR